MTTNKQTVEQYMEGFRAITVTRMTEEHDVVIKRLVSYLMEVK